MWKILQYKKADDFIIATGKQYSIKEFIEIVSAKLNMKIEWKGKGIKEKGYWNNRIIIECDQKYFRPLDVENLIGDASKAKKVLNWKPKTNIKQLVQEMIDSEVNN